MVPLQNGQHMAKNVQDFIHCGPRPDGIPPEGGPLYVSDAIHKAFINVNERGTEAGTTTVIGSGSSGPPTFRADHPFVFVIQDTETGSILFIGRLADPS